MSRGLGGGALMGLANLVPGISGGTMLLAAGVYPQCIAALVQVSKLRLERNGLALLSSIAGSACLIALLFAGVVKGLVVEYRWVMFSLFLGSTLGGVPVLWNLLGSPDRRSLVGIATGLAGMVVTAVLPAAPATTAGPSTTTLFLAGLAATAAMLLPGLSGAYLLVLSGQYVTILGAVDGIKQGLFHESGPQWVEMAASCGILVPVALGAVLAVVVVSRLIEYLLRRQRSLTLGFLLGLLLGAVLGLWPFQTVTAPAQLSLPSAPQAIASLGLIVCGFLVTCAIAHIGNGRNSS